MKLETPMDDNIPMDMELELAKPLSLWGGPAGCLFTLGLS